MSLISSNSFVNIANKFSQQKFERREWLWLALLLLFWVLVRLPNISHPFSLKMDAASAGVAWFIDESWSNQPASRWYAPVDHRTQWGELETGTLAPYLHCPPLALAPLGVWIRIFGLSEWSLRLGGLCSSLVFAFGAYWLCRTWFGVGQSLLVLGLMAVCPQSLHYSRSVDPIVTNMVWLPYMAWTYRRWKQTEQSPWALAFFTVSSLGMLSYWCAYGIFASLFLWHLCQRSFSKKIFFVFMGLPILALGLNFAYHILVWGGWEHFFKDFEYTLRTRTDSGESSWGVFFKTEAQRYIRNYGLVLTTSVAMCVTYIKTKPSVRFAFLLLFGALLFPCFVRRVTLVHEYFTIWSLLPLCMLSSEVWMMAIKNKKVIALAAGTLLVLGQGLYVGHNRMIRYDNDYLLAQALGRACQKHLGNAVILTDCRDNEHIFQYYSAAQCFLHADNIQALEKAIEIYKKSGRQEPIYFASTTADQLVKIVPELKIFPMEKFTGEFDLEANVDSDFWKYLERNYFAIDIDGFVAFNLGRHK
jgi:hypothetical protein